MSGDFISCRPKWELRHDEWQRAQRAKAAERRRLAVLVCVCVVALATLALWRLGPMPVEMLP